MGWIAGDPSPGQMAQMTTALRPIVGTSDDFLPKEKKFFLKHWFEQLDKA